MAIESVFELKVLEGIRVQSVKEKLHSIRSSWMLSVADFCIARLFVCCAPCVPSTTLCVVSNNKPIQTTVENHSVERYVKKRGKGNGNEYFSTEYNHSPANRDTDV